MPTTAALSSASPPSCAPRTPIFWAPASCSGRTAPPRAAWAISQVEELALNAIRQVSSLGKNDTVLTSDGTELFVEGFTTPPTLVLMGGGHIGKATSTLAATLGFRTYVVDDRPEFANPDRFPEAAGTIIAPYSEGLAQVPINANTYIVVATRGHRQDDYALEAAIGTPATYVGLLGIQTENPAHLQGLARKRPLARSAAKVSDLPWDSTSVR